MTFLLALAALGLAALALGLAGAAAVRTKARLQLAERAREELERKVAQLALGRGVEQLMELVTLGEHLGRFPEPVSRWLWQYTFDVREEWLAGHRPPGP